MDICGKRDAALIAICGSYITGFIAGNQAALEAAVVQTVVKQVEQYAIPPTDQAMEDALAKVRAQQHRECCIRTEWTAGYVQAVVGQYAREHPEALNRLSADHMMKVLAKAFPCGASK